MLKKSTLLLFLGITFLISCSKDDNRDRRLYTSNEINKSTAIDIAQYFFKNSNSKAGKGVDNTKTIKDITTYKTLKNETAFYVINYNQGGFIVIAADNRISPILAFYDIGKFNTNLTETPEPVIEWMESEKEQVQYTIDHNLKQSKNIALEWRKITTDINETGPSQPLKSITGRIDPDPTPCADLYITKGPLLKTSWDQWGNGFNNLIPYDCPSNPGGKAPTGCVATAMAQILFYFKKPNTYNWSNMPTTYGTYDTQLLMKDAGLSVNMQYNCEGSGAYAINIVPALKNTFGYSNASYTTTYSSTLITDNIDTNKPVLLGGFPSSGSGHAWVCDGYQRNTYYERDNLGNCTGFATTTLYLNMNWGWGGQNNGYYAYNNFNPGTSSYNNNRTIIYNITP